MFNRYAQTPFVVSVLYERLRTRLANIDFGIPRINGRCFVLGSAPNGAAPQAFDSNWTLVTVNASQAALRSMGCDRVPDITVMSGRMLGTKPANIAGQEAIKGLSTRHLVLIDRGKSTAGIEEKLLELDYRYDALTCIDHWQRSRISYEVIGEYASLGSGNNKISTGIFAACFAYHLGSESVVLSGFSFSAGHAYNAAQHKRNHVEYDSRALGVIRNRNLPFFSADREFSERSNLPMW